MCEKDECENKHYAKGLCRKHYDQQRLLDMPEYYASVKRRSYEKHREKNLESSRRSRESGKLREWVEKNYERKLALNHAYRARKRNARISKNYQKESSIVRKMYLSCLKCGRADNLTLDHIVPLSRGGAESLENYQILCLWCNSEKGTKVIDFRPSNWMEKYEAAAATHSR